jgi:hypothetical protein
MNNTIQRMAISEDVYFRGCLFPMKERTKPAFLLAAVLKKSIRYSLEQTEYRPKETYHV